MHPSHPSVHLIPPYIVARSCRKILPENFAFPREKIARRRKNDGNSLFATKGKKSGRLNGHQRYTMVKECVSNNTPAKDSPAISLRFSKEKNTDFLQGNIYALFWIDRKPILNPFYLSNSLMTRRFYVRLITSTSKPLERFSFMHNTKPCITTNIFKLITCRSNRSAFFLLNYNKNKTYVYLRLLNISYIGVG